MRYLPSMLVFIASMFDSGQMARDRLGPDPDRLLAAWLDGIAKRHARWGAVTEDERPAGVAELRDVAGATVTCWPRPPDSRSAQARPRALSMWPRHRP